MAAAPNPAIAQAYQFFLSKGYQPHQAAALAGNAMAESRLDPNIKGDKGSALGAFQWRGPRQAQLMDWAKREGVNPYELPNQLAFFDWELKNTERGAGQRLAAAKDVTEANNAVVSSLRPGGYTPDAPQNANGYARRLSYAQGVLGQAPPGQATAQAPAAPAAPPAADPAAAGGGGAGDKPRVNAAALAKMGSDLLAQGAEHVAATPQLGQDPGVYQPQVGQLSNPFRKRKPQAVAQAQTQPRPWGLLGGVDG